jgi:hypothetical protein
MSKYAFSAHSKKQLKTCDSALQEIMGRAILEYDFSILEGFRGEAAQNNAFDNGFSKVRWPNGKHNVFPSKAVDVAPYPIRWNDPVRFCELAVIIKRIAAELFIKVKWGGDWGWDLAHWELVE